MNLPYEPDFFRLLGYFFAEGHVDNEHYLSLSFHVDETDYLADVKELIERYFGKSPIANAPRQNGLTLVLSSTEIPRTFAREFGSNVYEKHIPDWLSSAEPVLLAELITEAVCREIARQGVESGRYLAPEGAEADAIQSHFIRLQNRYAHLIHEVIVKAE